MAIENLPIFGGFMRNSSNYSSGIFQQATFDYQTVYVCSMRSACVLYQLYMVFMWVLYAIA